MKKIISLTITVILLLSTLFSFVSFANAELENGLQSEAYIVTDAATGQILYAKNYEKQETLSGEFMKIVNEYHKSLSLRYDPFVII